MSERHQELFLRVAAQRLDRLETLFDEASAPASLAELRRELHTLKGEANVMGRRDVGGLVHALEDCFAPAVIPSEPEGWASLIDLALEAADLVRVGLERPDELAGAAPELVARLAARAGSGAAQPPAGAPLEPSDEVAPLPEAPAAREARLNVGLARLDQLASGVERTALVRSRIKRQARALLEVAKGLSARYEGQDWSRELIAMARALGEDAFFLDQSVQGLGEIVRELRLAPLQELFLEFRRPVRDLARRLGKEVELTLEGGQAELDQSLLELLREPLLHLVQNALDHGLELPEERRAAGKPEAGRLALSARQEGTRVRIEVSDDGRGLDPAKLKEQAVARRVLSAAQAERLSESEAYDLAFASGLSTAGRVSEVSGRGVGLDVVRARIEQHRGRVWLESTPGQGTTFHLDVPLSLLLVPALHVEVAGHAYALAVDQVERVTTLDPARIHALGERPAYSLGERLIPLIDLAASLPGTPPAAPGAPLVILRAPRPLAVAVERVLGQLEVVFRALDGFLAGAPTVRSACVLPDGRVALLLAPEALSRRAARASGDGPRGPRRILVADDSPVTRELLVEIVRSAGFVVESVEDGAAALARLRADPAHLLLTDLEMPILDGIGLARAVREEEGLRDLPVVIITTRGSDADRRACLAAGADAFLDKSRFDEGALIELLRRLLA